MNEKVFYFLMGWLSMFLVFLAWLFYHNVLS